VRSHIDQRAAMTDRRVLPPCVREWVDTSRSLAAPHDHLSERAGLHQFRAPFGCRRCSDAEAEHNDPGLPARRAPIRFTPAGHAGSHRGWCFPPWRPAPPAGSGCSAAWRYNGIRSLGEQILLRAAVMRGIELPRHVFGRVPAPRPSRKTISAAGNHLLNSGMVLRRRNAAAPDNSPTHFVSHVLPPSKKNWSGACQRTREASE